MATLKKHESTGDTRTITNGTGTREFRTRPPIGEVHRIARCPEHGLHGQRQECHECGGDVDQVPMVEVRGMDDGVEELRSRLKTIDVMVNRLNGNPATVSRTQNEAVSVIRDQVAQALQMIDPMYAEGAEALGFVEYQGTTDFGEGTEFRDAASFLGDYLESADDEDFDRAVLALDITPNRWNHLGQPRKLKIYAMVDPAGGFGEARSVDERVAE